MTKRTKLLMLSMFLTVIVILTESIMLFLMYNGIIVAAFGLPGLSYLQILIILMACYYFKRKW